MKARLLLNDVPADAIKSGQFSKRIQPAGGHVWFIRSPSGILFVRRMDEVFERGGELIFVELPGWKLSNEKWSKA